MSWDKIISLEVSYDIIIYVSYMCAIVDVGYINLTWLCLYMGREHIKWDDFYYKIWGCSRFELI